MVAACSLEQTLRGRMLTVSAHRVGYTVQRAINAKVCRRNLGCTSGDSGFLTLGLVSIGVLVFATGRQPEQSGAINLIEDPGFESGVSGFSAQDSSSSVTQSSDSPLEGGYSLRVSIAGYGNNMWWIREFPGGLASRFV